MNRTKRNARREAKSRTASELCRRTKQARGIRKFETHVLMTQGELLEALEKAADVAYAAPGAAVHA